MFVVFIKNFCLGDFGAVDCEISGVAFQSGDQCLVSLCAVDALYGKERTDLSFLLKPSARQELENDIRERYWQAVEDGQFKKTEWDDIA